MEAQAGSTLGIQDEYQEAVRRKKVQALSMKRKVAGGGEDAKIIKKSLEKRERRC